MDGEDTRNFQFLGVREDYKSYNPQIYRKAWVKMPLEARNPPKTRELQAKGREKNQFLGENAVRSKKSTNGEC